MSEYVVQTDSTRARWVADAARSATLLYLASCRLRKAIDGGDPKHILKTAEKLQESLR